MAREVDLPHPSRAWLLSLAAGDQDAFLFPWSVVKPDGTQAAFWCAQEYRESRLHNYMNYENLTEHQVQSSRQALEEEINAHPVSQDAEMFAFENNERLLRSSIVHFQLRNLVWATSSHDVFVTHVNEIVHYSYHTERTTPVTRPECQRPCTLAARLAVFFFLGLGFR